MSEQYSYPITADISLQTKDITATPDSGLRTTHPSLPLPTS